VVFDRARAEEQPSADLRIGAEIIVAAATAGREAPKRAFLEALDTVVPW
jgi:hypothetical protein